MNTEQQILKNQLVIMDLLNAVLLRITLGRYDESERKLLQRCADSRAQTAEMQNPIL